MAYHDTKVTNSMEWSPSKEDDSHSATQQIPCLYGLPKVHYHVHKNLPLDPILSQITPVHTFTPYY